MRHRLEDTGHDCGLASWDETWDLKSVAVVILIGHKILLHKDSHWSINSIIGQMFAQVISKNEYHTCLV